MIEGFTVVRLDEKQAKEVTSPISGGEVTSPWQDGKTFRLATEHPFGLATSPKGRKFAVVYLVDDSDNEAALWLTMLTKTVLDSTTKTVLVSKRDINVAFAAKVSGSDDPHVWWNAATDLFKDGAVCHRDPVWIEGKRYVLIGFDKA